MSQKHHWKYLMDRFISNTCTKEEFEELMTLIENGNDEDQSMDLMRTHWENTSGEEGISKIWKERFEDILHHSNTDRTTKQIGGIRRIQSHKWIAAAVIIFIVAGYVGLKLNSNADNGKIVNKTLVTTNATGKEDKNKATLVLSDGRRINLDTAHNGTLAVQGSVKIIKGEAGEILYYPDRQKKIPNGYNYVITPKGGKYCVVLSDGTKVWLNAASSIKFPAAFANDIRNVMLEGEAYFEVAKNISAPFHVKVGDMNVKVLGTHFNINAYDGEEHVSATLIEGAVKISINKNSSRGIILKPGQQAKLKHSNGRLTMNHTPDMGEVLAWKYGNFEFVNTPVPVILREIARWYDLDIINEKNVASDKRLTGTFSRNMKLEQLAAMLQFAGINMTVNNKKLFILPN